MKTRKKNQRVRDGETMLRQAVLIALLKTELVMPGDKHPRRKMRVFMSMLNGEFGRLMV